MRVFTVRAAQALFRKKTAWRLAAQRARAIDATQAKARSWLLRKELNRRRTARNHRKARLLQRVWRGHARQKTFAEHFFRSDRNALHVHSFGQDPHPC